MSQYKAMAIPQSQTMPQLHYTRDDIREQYLGSVARDSKRAKSSDPKRRADESASEPDDDDDDETSGSPTSEGAGPRGRQRSRKRRRRRRANSASIFSACFQIPNLSSILTPSQNIVTASNSGQTKRSILAHLGIGKQTDPSTRRSRISSSQTAGNLQQIDDSEWAGPRTTAMAGNNNGNRKHVSFLAGKQSNNDNIDAQLILQKKNTVITTSQLANKEEEANEANKSNKNISESANNNNNKLQNQPTTINLLSQSGHNKKTRNELVCSHAHNLIYHNQSAIQLEQQRRTNNFPVPIQLRPGPPTIYKRLPAVPMRTQATQTEITAYHLMATPPLSSTSSGKKLAALDTASSTSAIIAQEVPKLAPEDGSDEWSVEEEEEAPVEGTCGNLDASALISSSNSSSSVSLVGHDSTLLQLAADNGAKNEDDVETSIMMRADEQPERDIREEEEEKLKILDNREEKIGDISGAVKSAPEDIEPPCEFKDHSLDCGEWRDVARNVLPAPADELDPDPPSLSEASSQTDESLAKRIMHIGRSISTSVHDPTNEEPLKDAHPQVETNSNCAANRPLVIDGQLHEADLLLLEEEDESLVGVALGGGSKFELDATQRRDDFLDLADEQIANEATCSNSRSRSTTSTLSTRHHSYCSADDFQLQQRDTIGIENRPEVRQEDLLLQLDDEQPIVYPKTMPAAVDSFIRSASEEEASLEESCDSIKLDPAFMADDKQIYDQDDSSSSSSTTSSMKQEQKAAEQTKSSAESPPTTVSELDEELSMPSFVDSYRNKLEQFRALADQISNELISESCLMRVLDNGALMRIDERPAIIQLEDPGSSESSQSTSTTSVDNTHSYLCCHPKSEPHRPPVPQKPAHLRDVGKGPEAAAAYAVTATSVAGALAQSSALELLRPQQCIPMPDQEAQKEKSPVDWQSGDWSLTRSAGSISSQAAQVSSVPLSSTTTFENDTTNEQILSSSSDFASPALLVSSRSGSLCSANSVILADDAAAAKQVPPSEPSDSESSSMQSSRLATFASSPKLGSHSSVLLKTSEEEEEEDESCVVHESAGKDAPFPIRRSSIELSTVSEESEQTVSCKVASTQQVNFSQQFELQTTTTGDLATERDLALSDYTLRSASTSSGSQTEQRRRSTAQSGTLSSRKSPVDCPLVLPEARSGSPPIPQTRRLSHDDTMEAIEDDIEGEEEELRAQLTADNTLEPPAEFQASGCPPDPAVREDSDEESSVSVSQRGVLVQRADTPTRSQEENSGKAEKLKQKSLSSESTTQAILDHLSRHHRELTLDEPALSLEHSRSVDTNQRRESWRRKSSPKQQQQQQESPTATMKRKPRDGATVQETPVDNSICSSCSCLESSFDQKLISKPSSSTALPERHWLSQEEGSVFTENYWLSHWLYISEHEESEIWRRAIDMNPVEQKTEEATSGSSSSSSFEDRIESASTSSERAFSSKYKSTTRKMIHRRATIEMYKRMMNDNLKREKRVEISRSNGEFGFRIHGSRPVVVSAIERGTSAETCGLQVGDLIYAINGTNILDMAHSDVVKLAHSDSCALVLDLVPTNDFLRLSKYSRLSNKRYEPTVTGFLLRLSPSTAQPMLIELQKQMAQLTGASSQQRAAKLNEVMRLAWRRRYFVLRSDNCLYWYKCPTDIEPFGGINLQGFSASLTNEFSEPNYVIRLVKYGGQPHYLGTNNICDIQTWIDAINKAATEANQDDPYMKRTLTLARTKPNQIDEPDCSGYLYKFSQKRSGGAHWRAAYFVLKDACLYLFRDQQAESVSQASAVYYLHGYRCRSKQIEQKKHTFELIPPNRKTIRPMFLMANSEIDKKRWIAALEYSIERWIEID